MYLSEMTLMFVTFLILIGLTTSASFIVSSFECSNETTCDRFVSLAQHGDSGFFYITTTKTVKKLNEDLLQQLERKTVVEPQVENVLTILRGNEFLTCKNDRNGTCELRDADTLDVLSPEFQQTGIVYPGDTDSDVIGWIPGGVESQLVTAVSNKVMREGSLSVPLVATRSLSDGSSPPSTDGFLKFLTDEFNIPSTKFPALPCLSDEIKPFYGFTSGNHNYILKRHTGVTGEGTTIKLIRICKGSPNFRSYIELPIRCNINGQAAVDSSPDHIVFSTAYFTNDTLFISITKTRNMTQQVESHVCGYKITKIDEQFTQRRRECLEGATETTELTWHLKNYCPQKPPTQVRRPVNITVWEQWEGRGWMHFPWEGE